ncbi:MAG: hypothetical protein JWO58_2558 [Chitinophagaceae bacterium]|nr:hypothetical protein [Chitinophagaceae bacterium]
MSLAKITPFIKSDYQTIGPFESVSAVKTNLIRVSALVVQDESLNILGVLTLNDIVERSYNLVIDCLSPKVKLNTHDTIDNVLVIMKEQQQGVLPVYREHEFEGLVFKNDLIDFIEIQKNELEKKIDERTLEINSINENLETSKKVLKAFFDSTQSVIFIISPEYKIIFFNKKSYDNGLLFRQREIKIGDNIMDYVNDIEDEVFHSFRSDFDKALQGECVTMEKEIKYTGDKSIWFNIDYFPVYENEIMIGVAITITDINDRKKYELQIEQQNELLRGIAWTQSHKTRQPVATILGLVNIINKSELSEKNREVIDYLEMQTKELDKVIRETVLKAVSLEP